MNGIVGPRLFPLTSRASRYKTRTRVSDIGIRCSRRKPDKTENRHNATRKIPLEPHFSSAIFSLAIMCDVVKVVFACGCEKMLDPEATPVRCEYAKLKGIDCPSFQLTESVRRSELNCLPHS